jgi:hypothetical protein
MTPLLHLENAAGNMSLPPPEKTHTCILPHPGGIFHCKKSASARGGWLFRDMQESFFDIDGKANPDTIGNRKNANRKECTG